MGGQTCYLSNQITGYKWIFVISKALGFLRQIEDVVRLDNVVGNGDEMQGTPPQHKHMPQVV